MIVNLTQTNLSDTKGHILAVVVKEPTTWLRCNSTQGLEISFRNEFRSSRSLLSSGLASLSARLSPPDRTPSRPSVSHPSFGPVD